MVCSTFARLARVLGEARTKTAGSQSPAQDALLAVSESDPILFQGGLEQFEGLFGANMIEQLTNYESFSFSSMLDSWNGDETRRPGSSME